MAKESKNDASESDMDKERPGKKSDYGRGKAMKTRKKKHRNKRGRG